MGIHYNDGSMVSFYRFSCIVECPQNYDNVMLEFITMCITHFYPYLDKVINRIRWKHFKRFWIYQFLNDIQQVH